MRKHQGLPASNYSPSRELIDALTLQAVESLKSLPAKPRYTDSLLPEGKGELSQLYMRVEEHLPQDRRRKAAGRTVIDYREQQRT
jgi:hypothetical protein